MWLPVLDRSFSGKRWRWVLLSLVFVGFWPQGMQAQQWQTYTTANGLADDRVLSMLEASDGSLWFALQDFEFDVWNCYISSQDTLSHVSLCHYTGDI